MDVKHALNDVIDRSPWTKTFLAEQFEVSNQVFNDRINRNKNPKIDFVLEVLDKLGYDLIIVPKSSRKPDNAIVLTQTEESNRKVGRPKKDKQ